MRYLGDGNVPSPAPHADAGTAGNELGPLIAKCTS
jgi:hypothetical protein